MAVSSSVRKNIQTIIFDKKKFNRDEALTWAKTHGYKYHTSRIEGDTIRVRQFPPEQIKLPLGKFKMGKDIKAFYVVRNHAQQKKK